jgi:hypothetical protein
VVLKRAAFRVRVAEISRRAREFKKLSRRDNPVGMYPYFLNVLCLTAALFILAACNAGPKTLSWEDTSENEDGFRIYRVADHEKKMIAEVGPDVTHYVDRNAPPGSCYIVTAFNTAGESPATNSACGSK